MVRKFFFFLIEFISSFVFHKEVSYPDDVYIPQEVPSEPAAAQPETPVFPPDVVPQVDRTRKPLPNQKPESPVIEQKDLPAKQVKFLCPIISFQVIFCYLLKIEEELPEPTPTSTLPPAVVPTKDQPEVPDRSIKPITPTTITQEQPEMPDRTIKPVPIIQLVSRIFKHSHSIIKIYKICSRYFMLISLINSFANIKFPMKSSIMSL